MNNYEEYLHKLDLDELNNIHSKIDGEKYKERFELVKKELSDRKRGKRNKVLIKNDKIEVTSNKNISLITILLFMILFPCGVYIIHRHGAIGIVIGIFFVLLSVLIGTFGFKDLFELPVIGQFDNLGYEDYRIGIKLPYEDFELVIRPSHRISIVGVKITNFRKYEPSMRRSQRIKCLKRNKDGNGHMFFTNYNVDIADLLKFVDKAKANQALDLTPEN